LRRQTRYSLSSVRFLSSGLTIELASFVVTGPINSSGSALRRWNWSEASR
jgi:hypothetical protein